MTWAPASIPPFSKTRVKEAVPALSSVFIKFGLLLGKVRPSKKMVTI